MTLPHDPARRPERPSYLRTSRARMITVVVLGLLLLIGLPLRRLLSPGTAPPSEGPVADTTRASTARADSLSRAVQQAAPDTTPDPIPLTINGVLPMTSRRMSLFMLPGQERTIAASLSPALAQVAAQAYRGHLSERTPGVWQYRAPETGVLDMITLEVRHPESGQVLSRTRLRICLMIPARKLRKGSLEGYQIGSYAIGLRDPIYAPPSGYYKVSEAFAQEWASESVRFGNLVTKQTTTYPRYIVTDTRLLVKLDATLQELRRAGVAADSFSFVSGYRTPYYNAMIENVNLSRHQYGDAADVFIDEDGDGWMDDLNGDGRIDIHDAEVIGRVLERMDTMRIYRHLVGGVGLYDRKPDRTPFVHIDTRGKRARWRH